LLKIDSTNSLCLAAFHLNMNGITTLTYILSSSIVVDIFMQIHTMSAMDISEQCEGNQAKEIVNRVVNKIGDFF
jgi:hypothetical protein